MQSIEFNTYRIPEFYLSYIFNDDESGLLQSELDQFNTWYEKLCENLQSYCKENNINFNKTNIVFDCSDGENFNESYFTYHANIINTGCQAVDCTIVLLY